MSDGISSAKLYISLLSISVRNVQDEKAIKNPCSSILPSFKVGSAKSNPIYKKDQQPLTEQSSSQIDKTISTN